MFVRRQPLLRQGHQLHAELPKLIVALFPEDFKFLRVHAGGLHLFKLALGAVVIAKLRLLTLDKTCSVLLNRGVLKAHRTKKTAALQ